ncbi:MAG TPA: nucleoside kinase [Rectinemataceae bacterium]|nr:nucleoside kinase [Rectinemataceae bacterium]
MRQITVTYASGEKIAFPAGAKVSDTIGHMGSLSWPLAAVLVNNALTPLDATLLTDCTVLPVTLNTPQGAITYRRSLCFLLAIAVRDIQPGRRLVAGMAIGTGFFHQFADDRPMDASEIAALEARMRELVERDQPINIEQRSWAEAVEYFRSTSQSDTLLLLENLNDSIIPLNECSGFRDLYVHPLVPSTGVLRTFEVLPYHNGLLLRYPHKEEPDKIRPFVDDPVLFSIAKETRERALVLGVFSVGSLNRVNGAKGGIKNYIQVAEALQNKKLAGIADQIAERSGSVKVVLIAGPSSSGKTTMSKKLSIQLKVMGFEPLVISLDDYFVDRERTPRDESGEYDFECLEALDVEYLNDQLLTLFAGEEIELPSFDFKTGTRKNSGKRLRMGKRHILVMEGIHGLNDRLTPRIPKEQKFKVYISALTQLNLDDHNRVSTTDNRLLRRMVRDYNFRGHSAGDTLKMWPSVQRGEARHIFPFQNSADAAFNSALDYELGVLKIYADPLLRTVKPTESEYSEARRIQAFLDNFTPIPAQNVPRDSILREFIGDSEFKY